MKNLKLWHKLEALNFDDMDATFPFSARLSRENSWTEQYTLNVIEEYKRFAYLAMVSKTPVTPSDAVDQVWHLHMIYTEHYWDIFCKILGRKLHHGPTKGGQIENAKYWDQYKATLELYKSEFKQIPPLEIWLDINARFDRNSNFIRVDQDKYWIVPKITVLRVSLSFKKYLIAFISIFFTGLAYAQSTKNVDDGNVFWSRLAIIVFVILIIMLIKRVMKKSKNKNNSGGGCGSNLGCGSGGCGGCGG